MYKFKVNEIFTSIDGEGKRSGMPASFIRLSGCNLRCSFCDTRYAFDEYTEMTADEIISKLDKPLVTLTGGEPLASENIEQLVSELIFAGKQINIETNGSVDIVNFLTKLPVHKEEQLFFTIDYKLPSSGMEDKMLAVNYESLMPHDVVKFVVGDDADFDRMLEINARLMRLYAPEDMPLVYIGCVFDKYSPRRLAERIIAEEALNGARLQLQLHKFIWDPSERGV